MPPKIRPDVLAKYELLYKAKLGPVLIGPNKKVPSGSTWNYSFNKSKSELINIIKQTKMEGEFGVGILTGMPSESVVGDSYSQPRYIVCIDIDNNKSIEDIELAQNISDDIKNALEELFPELKNCPCEKTPGDF